LAIELDTGEARGTEVIAGVVLPATATGTERSGMARWDGAVLSWGKVGSGDIKLEGPEIAGMLRSLPGGERLSCKVTSGKDGETGGRTDGVVQGFRESIALGRVGVAVVGAVQSSGGDRGGGGGREGGGGKVVDIQDGSNDIQGSIAELILKFTASMLLSPGVRWGNLLWNHHTRQSEKSDQADSAIMDPTMVGKWNL
jgi:hypothetical protein